MADFVENYHTQLIDLTVQAGRVHGPAREELERRWGEVQTRMEATETIMNTLILAGADISTRNAYVRQSMARINEPEFFHRAMRSREALQTQQRQRVYIREQLHALGTPDFFHHMVSWELNPEQTRGLFRFLARMSPGDRRAVFDQLVAIRAPEIRARMLNSMANPPPYQEIVARLEWREARIQQRFETLIPNAPDNAIEHIRSWELDPAETRGFVTFLENQDPRYRGHVIGNLMAMNDENRISSLNYMVNPVVLARVGAQQALLDLMPNARPRSRERVQSFSRRTN